MVTVKFTQEEFEQLRAILMENTDKSKGLSSLVEDTYYGNSKRIITEKQTFNYASFEKHLEDKRAREHNEFMDLINDKIVYSIEKGCSVAYVPFDEKQRLAAESCFNFLKESGFKDENLEIKKPSIYDRYVLKTDCKYIFIIHF